jgi:hypothetical protein
MAANHKLLDRAGKPLAAGNSVAIRKIPQELISGLPNEDQAAILACLDRIFSISDFDAYGHVEIEFTDAEGVLHTIWIRPDCLELQ